MLTTALDMFEWEGEMTKSIDEGSHLHHEAVTKFKDTGEYQALTTLLASTHTDMTKLPNTIHNPTKTCHSKIGMQPTYFNT